MASPKTIYAIITEVGAYGRRGPPLHADDDHVACFLFEGIVRGDDRITGVGPADLPFPPRPQDAGVPADRLGDPARCVTMRGHEFTAWPWFDLELGRECVVLGTVHLRSGIRRRVTPLVRAHYRDKLSLGFF